MKALTRIGVGSLAIAAATAIVLASVSAYRDFPSDLRGGFGGGEFGSPAEAGRIANPAIRESSGIVASRRNRGVLWTHNDSGGRAQLFALDETGRTKATYTLTGVKAYDWEDMAAGPGPTNDTSYLYIGDIGDNTKRRKELSIYRVVEPVVEDRGSRQLSVDARLRLVYPDGPHDAESMFVHPKSGDVYVLTKTTSNEAGVYAARAPLSPTKQNRMERVASLSIDSLFGSLVTGADVSRDGRRIVLCNYLSAYELQLDPASASFDDIWSRPLRSVSVPARPQGESICYSSNGNAVYLTSEGERSPLWVVRRSGRR